MKPIHLITIRQLMPPRYLPRIAQMTNKGRSTISNVVNDETITSSIWWAVEQLARETDPEGYEQRMEWIKQDRSGK